MNKIKEFVNDIGLEISDKQLEQFNMYYEMLVEKNKVMNLTAITEKDEVVIKHFIDSIALAKYYDFSKNIKLIDVGTGAGFPGLPLKILFPNIKVTLFDSLNKRILFLNEVIEKLELDNIEAVHGRAEEGARNAKMREGYDLVVSRAVANMAVLSEYCLPFVKVGGYFIPYKTASIDEELNSGKKAINILGGKCEKVNKLCITLDGFINEDISSIDDNNLGRSFIFIKKEKNTPKAYPRKAGTANKQPLL